MAEPRLHIPHPGLQADRLLISGRKADHAAARRLKTGETLSLFDGLGGEARARVLGWEKTGMQVEVFDRPAAGPRPMVAVTLIVGLIRPERFRLLVEKSCELGVDRITPLLCRRSQPERTFRLDKMNQAAVEALKQCRRSHLPVIESPRGLEAILDATTGPGSRMVLDFSGRPPGGPNDDQSGTWPHSLNRERQQAALLIGPEGGLEPGELEAAVRAGYRAVRISDAVLRTETAALAALALIQAGALTPIDSHGVQQL